jgi:hypothetical protein
MSQTAERVKDAATEAFLREADGWQVDHPLLHRPVMKPESGPTMIDERFGQLADDRPMKLRNALTRFVNAHSREKEIADVLQQGGIVDGSEGRTGVCIFHVSDTGEEIPINIERLDGGDGWTGKALGKRYHAATRDDVIGLISRELNNNQRNLTSAELRDITILCCTTGEGFYSGVKRYVAKRTGMDEDEVLTDSAIRDGKHASIYDSAVLHCWLAIRPDFSPGEDFGGFVAQFAMGRHLSVALLDGCRQEYEKRCEALSREALFSTVSPDVERAEEPPTYNQLDALSDDDITAQFRSVRREQARHLRSGIV